MEKKCAFCSSSGPFTKEHVIPGFLYKQYKNHNVGFNQKADRYLSYEAMVKDVCASCNNGVLSQLDEYGKTFLTNNQNNKQRVPGENHKISYNFDLLLRWLLKISYNTLRMNGTCSQLLEQSIPYILGLRTNLDNSYLFLQILSSHKISERDRKSLLECENRSMYEDIPHMEDFPHYAFRLGRVQVTGLSEKSIYIRHVTIFDFCFYLVLIQKTVPKKSKLIKKIMSDDHFNGATLLNQHQKSMTIEVSKRSSLDAYAFNGMRLARKWKSYLKENKR